MKLLIRTCLLLALISVTSCSEEKSRDFFAAGGIAVGKPVALGGGAYQVPMEFKTEIDHSGQWLDEVTTRLDGTDILITASFAPANRKSQYPGHVEIGGASPGSYTLKYQDPDGTTHVIETIVLP